MAEQWKPSFSKLGLGAMDLKHCIGWLQIILLICSEVVETAVTSSDLPPSAMITMAPSSSDSPVNAVSITQQLPNIASRGIPTVNSTSSIPNPSSGILMSTLVMQTSQEMMFDSTQSMSSFPSSSSGIQMSTLVIQTSQEMMFDSTQFMSNFPSSSSGIQMSTLVIQTSQEMMFDSTQFMSNFPSSSSGIQMSTLVIQTSQEMMFDSTQFMSIFPSSSLTQQNSMTTGIPEQASPMLSVSQMSTLELSASIPPTAAFPSPSSSQYLMQTSMGISELVSTISPSPSDVVPVLTSSIRDQIDSSIPSFTSEMEMKSTIFPKQSVSATLAPTPSVDSSSVTMATPSLSSVSSFVPAMSSSLSPSVLQPSSSIMPSRTPIPSTTIPSLSSLPSSSSSVVLEPTPTSGAPTSGVTNPSPTVPGPTSRPPTTEMSTGGPLSMAQWIGVAVAATVVAVLILCLVIWFLLRGGKSRSKHKPHYTIENVKIDLSRSTSTDPRDVWRNSLLLETMSARIVMPDEDDDELMQAKQNPDGYQGFSNDGFADEDDQPSTSGQEKEVPLTKL